MAKCWRYIGKGQSNEDDYEFFGCGDTAEIRADGFYLDGRQAFSKLRFDSFTQVSVPIVRDSSKVANDASRGSCDACTNTHTQSPSDTYDCVNGNCIKNTNNSGYFKSLEDCQKLCAFSCEQGKQCVDPNTFCPPGKVCLDLSEYSQINSVIDRLEQEFCN